MDSLFSCDKEAFNLDGWTKNYPVLGEAYRLKEAFYEIYDAATPGEAMRRYEAWYRSITPENREPYSDLIRAWSNWQPYILNHFDHNITSGYVECLNSLIRVMNRLGRGYSFEALRAKILFTEGSHKHKLSRPKFERKRETEPAYKVAQEVCRIRRAVRSPAKGVRPTQTRWQAEELWSRHKHTDRAAGGG